jgi:ribosome-associated protein
LPKRAGADISERFLFFTTTEKETKPILKTHEGGLRSPEQLKAFIEETLDADKAEQIETLDLRGQSSIADYMIVASGRSSTQIGALAKKLQEKLKLRGRHEVHLEGMEQCNWVIVDAGDVVVHLFRPEVRNYYNLEKMWDMPSFLESRNGATGLHTVA